ncbi:MAG: DotH/IcmK family type IV secretion protein, partial [Pseudomonadota bacterium]
MQRSLLQSVISGVPHPMAEDANTLAPLPPAPKLSAAPQKEDPMADAAFRSLLQKTLPLSPDQIRQFYRLYDLTQQAAAAAPTTPPNPVSSSLVVQLGPGTTPPVVRLAAGFVS